jgi:serine/threonine-protein phosphatase PP1 catalytic subunit
MVLRPHGPITVVGDIHGQFRDLCRMLERIPQGNSVLFLGDYVDRGPQSLEVVMMLFVMKIREPGSVFLLRGNHETRSINSAYGFREEVGDVMWSAFNEVFDCLPLAAVIGEKIFCVHGGLSPELADLSQIEDLQRPLAADEMSGLVCDLLWSDPTPQQDEFIPNDRGAGRGFGPAITRAFCAYFGFDFVLRAHQASYQGYEFSFYPETTVLTLFSAPDYCGMGNRGALLNISAELFCSLDVVEPEPRVAFAPEVTGLTVEELQSEGEAKIDRLLWEEE